MKNQRSNSCESIYSALPARILEDLKPLLFEGVAAGRIVQASVDENDESREVSSISVTEQPQETSVNEEKLDHWEVRCVNANGTKEERVSVRVQNGLTEAQQEMYEPTAVNETVTIICAVS